MEGRIFIGTLVIMKTACIHTDPFNKFELLLIPGLKYIYELTSLGYYQLRVDIAR